MPLNTPKMTLGGEKSLKKTLKMTKNGLKGRKHVKNDIFDPKTGSKNMPVLKGPF